MKKVMIIIIILIIPAIVMADTNEVNVLIIYGTEHDRDQIEVMLDDIDISISTKEITELTSNDIADQDQIILASSSEISMEDPVELALETYMSDDSHQFIMITPYLDEFSGNLQSKLGINSIDVVETEEDNETLQWTINPDIVYGNYTPSDTFSYYGTAAIVDLEPTTTTIASFSSVTELENESEDDSLELPSPAIWNISQAASIHTIATSLNSTSAGLQLDQTVDFVSTIVSELVLTTTHSIPNIDSTSGDTTIQTTSDNTPITTDTSTGGIFPSTGFNSTPTQLSFLAVLVGIIILLYSKFVSAVNWLIRKMYGLVFVIVGVFYNVQDRTLSHNEVMMNNSRADILAYLDHVGPYGAHLREIKSIMGMGSGSLLWHLQVLEDYGLIDKYSINSYTIFVADDYTFDIRTKEIELKIQSKYSMSLLDTLVHSHSDKMTLTQIEQETEISRRSLRRLLNKLASDEVISIDKYPQMRITIENQEMLRNLHQSFQLRHSFEFDKVSPHIEQLD